MGFQEILKDRVGFGKCQIITMILLTLVSIFQGGEAVLNTFLNPIFKEIFQGSSPFLVPALSSAFFIGCLFGSISSGFNADNYGRKIVLQVGSLLQVLMTLAYLFVRSNSEIFFVRFMNGLAFGFTLAITSSYLSEILPHQYRAKGILLIQSSAVLGKMFGVGVGFLFLEERLAQTNWRLMIVCSSLPSLLFLLFSELIPSSPQFLCSSGQYEQGFNVLNSMILANNGNEQLVLSFSQKQAIKAQFVCANLPSSQSYGLNHIFTSQTCTKIVYLSSTWIIINFCLVGQLNVQSLHLANHTTQLHDGLSKIWVILAGQVPSLILSIIVVDSPLLARKNSLILFFSGAALGHLIFSLTTWIFAGTLSRLCLKCTEQLMFPLTAQSFGTRIRARGTGFCLGLGKIGQIVMPFGVGFLDNWRQSSVYFCFSALSVLAGLIVATKVEETLQVDDEMKMQTDTAEE